MKTKTTNSLAGPSNPLADYKTQVEPLIAAYFSDLLACPDDLPVNARSSLTLIRDYTLRGGKRLRGALMYYAYRLFADTQNQAALKASIGMELVQTFALIVDDAMDGTKTRRGGPSGQEYFTSIVRGTESAAPSMRRSDSLAICAGVVALHLALGLISQSPFPGPARLAAITSVNHHAMRTWQGQMDDLASGVGDMPTVDELMAVLRWKSAAYTFEMPLHAGALLAGADTKALETLSDYAVPAGIVFQMQDDLLDVFQDKQGEPFGTDVPEGKRTVHIIAALEHAKKNDVRWLQSVLGQGACSPKAMRRIQAIVMDSGAYAFTVATMRGLLDQASAALKLMKDWDPEAVAVLRGVVEYLGKRDIMAL